jgi:hypothetical protein
MPFFHGRRWFDHPPVQPLLWRAQSLVPAMLVSRRSSRRRRPGLIKGSAFDFSQHRRSECEESQALAASS